MCTVFSQPVVSLAVSLAPETTSHDVVRVIALLLKYETNEHGLGYIYDFAATNVAECNTGFIV